MNELPNEIIVEIICQLVPMDYSSIRNLACTCSLMADNARNNLVMQMIYNGDGRTPHEVLCSLLTPKKFCLLHEWYNRLQSYSPDIYICMPEILN